MKMFNAMKKLSIFVIYLLMLATSNIFGMPPNYGPFKDGAQPTVFPLR